MQNEFQIDLSIDLRNRVDESAKKSWRRIRSVFDDALRQPAQGRFRYVQKRCGLDEVQCDEVKSLLDWHDRSEYFLETPAVVKVIEENERHIQLSSGQFILHYKIEKLIGKGGMGEVYLAHDTKLGRKVAIKLLRNDIHLHLRSDEILFREARAAALLEHPNVCQIYDISETGGLSFIVMQYVVGETLDYILSKEGPLELGTALELSTQIANGIAEAHSMGVIHRDIKPANIMISNKGQAKILDFGISKFLDADFAKADGLDRMEIPTGVMGTVPYMSPEQLIAENVDARTDVFSLGSLMFEMYSGASAFARRSNSETISAILKEEPNWSSVPISIRALLQKCLVKKPEGRFKTGAEVSSALAEVKTHYNQIMGRKGLHKARFGLGDSICIKAPCVFYKVREFPKRNAYCVTIQAQGVEFSRASQYQHIHVSNHESQLNC